MDAPAELCKEVTVGWEFPWGFEPSHLNWLTVGDIIVVIAIILVMILLGVWLVVTILNRDRYYEGLHDGLHNQLTALAKMRYNRETNTALFLIPEEEYWETMDRYCGLYYTPKWVQNLKKKFQKKKEGNHAQILDSTDALPDGNIVSC